MEGVIAAVLAGGRGSRLGMPKATAMLAGRPLIEYPLGALREAGLETTVVAKEDTELPELGDDVELWLEPPEPRHPLVGIVTALERAGGRPVLVCGCDVPFVTPELAGWFASLEVRIAVPLAGRLHPLFARYSFACLEALSAALARNAPLRETVSALRPKIVGLEELRVFGDPARLFFNVNTPADLAAAERLLARS